MATAPEKPERLIKMSFWEKLLISIYYKKEPNPDKKLIRFKEEIVDALSKIGTGINGGTNPELTFLEMSSKAHLYYRQTGRNEPWEAWDRAYGTYRRMVEERDRHLERTAGEGKRYSTELANLLEKGLEQILDGNPIEIENNGRIKLKRIATLSLVSAGILGLTIATGFGITSLYERYSPRGKRNVENIPQKPEQKKEINYSLPQITIDDIIKGVTKPNPLSELPSLEKDYLKR